MSQILKDLNKLAEKMGAPVVGRNISEQVRAISTFYEGTTHGANIAERINEVRHAYHTSGSSTLITKTVTENKTYNASDDEADGYSSVTVNVPEPTLITKSIIQNGNYSASADSADGYSSISVNVPSDDYAKGNRILTLIDYDWAVKNIYDITEKSVDLSNGCTAEVVFSIPSTAASVGRGQRLVQINTSSKWFVFAMANVSTDSSKMKFDISSYAAVDVSSGGWVPTSITDTYSIPYDKLIHARLEALNDSSRTINVYVNNQLIFTYAGLGSATYYNSENATNIGIMRQVSSTYDRSVTYYTAKDILIYNRVLSTEEKLNNYLVAKQKFNIED